LAELVRAELVTSGRWTDAYPAAFATVARVRLVTFASDFRGLPDLDLLHLAA